MTGFFLLVLFPQWWTSKTWQPLIRCFLSGLRYILKMTPPPPSLLFCLFWLVLSPQWWTNTSWLPLLRWSCARTMRHPRVGTAWQRTPPSVMTQPTNVSSVRAPATHAVRVNLLSDEMLFLRYSLNINLSGFLLSSFSMYCFYCASFINTVVNLKIWFHMNLNWKAKLNHLKWINK